MNDSITINLGDPEVRFILAAPSYRTEVIAQKLRALGHKVAFEIENERAHVIAWMLSMHAKHGAGWRDVANAELNGSATKEKP